MVSIWKHLLEDFPSQLSIETNTPVVSVDTSTKHPGHPYLIRTQHGSVCARQVIHATNAFASHLVPGLRSKITGIRAHMSAQQPGNKFPKTLGERSWSIIYGDGFDYVTQRPSRVGELQGDIMLGGGFKRSLKGGIDQVGLYDDSTPLDPLTLTHISGILPSVFSPKWGSGAEVKKAWTGILGMAGDMLPLVGRLDETLTKRNIRSPHNTSDGTGPPGEWLSAGFSGEGMVWAWLCGVALGIMVAGSEQEDIPATPGTPGGKLKEWFPNELRVSSARLRSADVPNLANEA